ncbi:F-box domain-containing protein [Apodospora peruviana]|uniref:F-box domain-containing protein n=1 Tax=Apodospora peruviana TaxID=516989 RepID=A0AAE0I4L3_9PEZI|nr:F-box domain-containing protein [Apodospora peruviana]
MTAFPPQDEPPSKKLDWEQELHDLVRLQLVCKSQTPDKKRAELPFVFKTVTRLLENASCRDEKDRERKDRGRGPGQSTFGLTFPPSRNASILARIFDNEETREAFMSQSFLFERARNETKRFQDPPKTGHQQSAKLHSLYGMPLLIKGGNGRTLRSSRLYPFACSKVYDLRQYTTGNSGWGPFMNDGTFHVDWEKIEAISLVLRENIRGKGFDAFPLFSNLWNTPFGGSWSGSYLPWPPNNDVTTCGGIFEEEEGDDQASGGSADEDEDGESETADENALRLKDPYGVTGTWLRIVCFLDYNDFFYYNFPTDDQLPGNVPRPVLDVGEATRLIMMKLNVTKIVEPGEDDHKDHPVVFFEGLSRSFDGSWDDNADSDIRGSVRVTLEGEVRWTTYSLFDGEERWKSEGIQIGGIQSARGVVGTWFEKDFDPHGPCGPMAYWKISEIGPKDKSGDVEHEILIHDFRHVGVQFNYDEESDPDDDDFEEEVIDDRLPWEVQYDEEHAQEMEEARIRYDALAEEAMANEPNPNEESLYYELHVGGRAHRDQNELDSDE